MPGVSTLVSLCFQSFPTGLLLSNSPAIISCFSHFPISICVRSCSSPPVVQIPNLPCRAACSQCMVPLDWLVLIIIQFTPSSKTRTFFADRCNTPGLCSPDRRAPPQALLYFISNSLPLHLKLFNLFRGVCSCCRL